MINVLAGVNTPNSLVVLLSDRDDSSLSRSLLPAASSPEVNVMVAVVTDDGVTVKDGYVDEFTINLLPGTMRTISTVDLVGRVDAPDATILSNRDVYGLTVNLVPGGTVPVPDLFGAVNSPNVTRVVNRDVSELSLRNEKRNKTVRTWHLVPAMSIPLEDIVVRVDAPGVVSLSNADLYGLAFSLLPMVVT